MPRLRKLRRSKSFRYNVNRKRLDKKIRGTGPIKCTEIRNAWNNRRTLGRNLFDIGLGNDPNKVVGIPSAKQERMKIAKLVNGSVEEDIEQTEEKECKRSKGYVLDQLEADANEFRESGFRLPKGIVSYCSTMMDKYQLNYKEMARDKKNYDQETWKQIRAKIRKFMSIPDQFNEYLKSRHMDAEQFDWQECSNDDE